MLSTKLILVSSAIRKRFTWLENTKKMVVVYNGIDLKEFDSFSSSSSIREELDIAQGTVLLGCIGRIEKRKGHEHLIAAMRDINNAKLVLVGRGVQKDIHELTMHCNSFNIADRVMYIGYRDDIPALLKAIDIFVFPSIRGEGFSRAILEAMAAGKPVVASDDGGNAEAVVDGLTGYIIPTGDSSSLAMKLNELVGDEKKRTAMGRSGRKRVEAFFTIQRNVEEIQNVYLDILEKHNRRSIHSR